jgi:hypothetical protein
MEGGVECCRIDNGVDRHDNLLGFRLRLKRVTGWAVRGDHVAERVGQSSARADIVGTVQRTGSRADPRDGRSRWREHGCRIPGAVLNAPIPHAPRALVSTEMVARALGELGRFADILRAAAMAIGPIRGTRMLPPRSATSRRRARSLSGHGREPCPERQPARRRQQSGYPPHERVRHRTSRQNVWLQSLPGRRIPKAWHRGSMYEPRTHTNKESRAPDTAELRGHNVQ